MAVPLSSIVVAQFPSKQKILVRFRTKADYSFVPLSCHTITLLPPPITTFMTNFPTSIKSYIRDRKKSPDFCLVRVLFFLNFFCFLHSPTNTFRFVTNVLYLLSFLCLLIMLTKENKPRINLLCYI